MQSLKLHTKLLLKIESKNEKKMKLQQRTCFNMKYCIYMQLYYKNYINLYMIGKL